MPRTEHSALSARYTIRHLPIKMEEFETAAEKLNLDKADALRVSMDLFIEKANKEGNRMRT